MSDAVNVDAAEVARFQAAASRWWDPEGEMRPLHELNPVRLEYVERAGSIDGRRIVDVGCGGGLLAEAMARRGARVTGLDLASELLQVAELHALESGITVDYRLETAEQHAVGHAGEYDVATCMEMLEHVPEPRSVVAALAALVRPGGHIFVSTINRNARAYLHAVVGAEYVLRLLPRGTHTYDKFIRPSELAAWGRSAGLETLDVAGLDYDPFARKARLTGDARINYLAHFGKALPARIRA
jgi:2-polyprenyl-6-hydroxyphenyl methylase / 3-demethylubiquinone-9 3-methyltransferase